MTTELTKQRLDELIDFSGRDPVWKVNFGSKGLKGILVGSLRKDGYLNVSIDGRKYLAHRLVWLHHHGVFPTMVDHRDRDKSNNHISNLREVTPRQNKHNVHKPQSNNTSGMRGVSVNPHGRYYARINIDGKGTHLGFFTTPEEAQAAYISAKKHHHPVAF